MTSRLDHPPTAETASSYRDRFRWWWPFVPLVVIVALLVTLHLAAPSAPTVARLTFVNNSAYDIEVDVAGAGAVGTLNLGTAAAHETTDVHDVVDQGSTWVVRFHAQGVNGGEERITRADLARADWNVTIPTAVTQRLAAAGLQPSPKTTG